MIMESTRQATRQELIEEVERLRKELDKEKEKNKKIKDGILFVGRRNGKSAEQKIILYEYISKDKIREKIDILNTNIVNAERFDGDYIGNCRFAKYILQELLQEGDTNETKV